MQTSDDLLARLAEHRKQIEENDLALHAGTQLENRERQRGTANISSASDLTSRPSGVAASRSAILKKLGGAVLKPKALQESDSSSGSSSNSSDDEGRVEIFPASMKGKVPPAGPRGGALQYSHKQGYLGRQALSMQVDTGGGRPSSNTEATRRESSQNAESDLWLKVDVLDSKLGAEEEDRGSQHRKVGSQVADLLFTGFEGWPRRSSLQKVPSQIAVLSRLEQRFNPQTSPAKSHPDLHALKGDSGERTSAPQVSPSFNFRGLPKLKVSEGLQKRQAGPDMNLPKLNKSGSTRASHSGGIEDGDSASPRHLSNLGNASADSTSPKSNTARMQRPSYPVVIRPPGAQAPVTLQRQNSNRSTASTTAAGAAPSGTGRGPIPSPRASTQYAHAMSDVLLEQ